MEYSGRIFKATAGFYYVETDNTEAPLLECRARGIFRKNSQTPFVGDNVKVSVNPDGKSGAIEEILPRKNYILRPPLANLDCVVVVMSMVEPMPSTFVTDKFLCILEHKNITPIIAITKDDLQCAGELATLYRKVGYEVYVVNNITKAGIPQLEERLSGQLSAFSGNSGVGKSTLLNAICPELSLETGETSKKLGRGRHTTRHVEIFRLKNGGLVADTPGFSSIDLLKSSDITKDDLADCFIDFAPMLGKCKFDDCSHTCEIGCAVIESVKNGDICPSRHESYIALYNEIKDIQKWER